MDDLFFQVYFTYESCTCKISNGICKFKGRLLAAPSLLIVELRDVFSPSCLGPLCVKGQFGFSNVDHVRLIFCESSLAKLSNISENIF